MSFHETAEMHEMARDEAEQLREQNESLLNQVVKFQTLLTLCAQAMYNAGFISHIAANEHAALRCEDRSRAIRWAALNNSIETQLKTTLEALKDQGFVPLKEGMPTG